MSISGRLNSLERKHGELEEQLEGLRACPSVKDEDLTSLKRRKLRIKDEIASLGASATTT